MVSRKELILKEEKVDYMTSSSKNDGKEKKRFTHTITLVDNLLPGIENDPVFLRKLEQAKRHLEKCPFPMELIEESRRRDRENRL